jgi:hypothetical protein
MIGDVLSCCVLRTPPPPPYDCTLIVSPSCLMLIIVQYLARGTSDMYYIPSHCITHLTTLYLYNRAIASHILRIDSFCLTQSSRLKRLVSPGVQLSLATAVTISSTTWSSVLIMHQDLQLIPDDWPVYISIDRWRHM